MKLRVGYNFSPFFHTDVKFQVFTSQPEIIELEPRPPLK